MSAPQNDPAETPPAPWYTEEMVKAAVDGIHEKNYVIHDSYVRELLRLDTVAAFDAIAPMVEKLLEMQSDGAYDMGYADGFRDGSEYTK